MGRSTYARDWLGSALLAWGVLALIAFFGDYLDLGPVKGMWTNPYIAVSIALVLLIAIAKLMHDRDYDKGTKQGLGYGVRYLYHQLAAQRSSDDNVIAGVLARESIQAAITVGIIAVLFSTSGTPKDFNKLFQDPQAALKDFNKFIQDPQAVLFAVVIVVLGASLITTVVAILCYDYATRFTWPKVVRGLFVEKGHAFGIFGFYSLLWSLAAIASILNPYLGMAVVLGIYIVMWRYYFFCVDEINAVLLGMSPSDLAGANLQGKKINNLDLHDVNLTNAQLQNAQLRHTNLEGATLIGAHLEGADLTGAVVTQQQLNSAVGDKATTKLPRGMVPPTTWP